MPSLKKTLHFLGSTTCCAGGVALLSYGMSENWSKTTVKCTSSTNNTIGSGIVTLGLFDGSIAVAQCPSFSTITAFTAMKELTGASLALQYVVIALLILALIGSAGSILITLYNSASNPYQTYMGPVGLYASAGFSVTTSFLALILHVSTIYADRSGETVIKNNIVGAELSDFKVDMQLGFFMVIPYIALNVLAILLVFLYVHAAYTQKREQQKPTEDAPKEIMMY